MSAEVDDRTLFEWVEGEAHELDAYLAEFPHARARVDEFRSVLAVCKKSANELPRVRPDRVGRYSLLRRIGRGGMGVVYEAEQDAPRRRVAIKLLSDAVFEDPVIRQRLAREAEALGRLAHPNVATVFEYGEGPDGEPYLALELVEGVALDVWAGERRGKWREIAELIEKVARAVQHAHQRGIVHRDIKPSNVLVGPRGEPKVLDFGLARLGDEAPSRSSALTTNGRVFGTLAYMSPEQARGAIEVGPAGDVYALGVMLYEALAGTLPHDLSARSLPEAARVIAEESPRALRRVVPGISRDLDLVCAKALAKEPRHRYASASDLADDLRRHLDGLPVRARRVSLSYHVVRMLRRYALEFAAALLIGLLGLFAVYASASRVNITELQRITGDWYRVAAAFDGLRWDGERPVVEIEGVWYDLLEIEGLRAGYVIGFCQQHAGTEWRRRFREDLLQVLNRLGRWPGDTVELVVADRTTGRVQTLTDVAFTSAKRRLLKSDDGLWYFETCRWTDEQLEVEHDGRRWVLESIDGVPAITLRNDLSKTLGARDCDVDGATLDETFLRTVRRMPHPTVEAVLSDPSTGQRLELTNVVRKLRPRSAGTRPANTANSARPSSP